MGRQHVLDDEMICTPGHLMTGDGEEPAMHDETDMLLQAHQSLRLPD